MPLTQYPSHPSLALQDFRRQPPASQWKFVGQSPGALQLMFTQCPDASQVSPSAHEVAVQAEVQVMAGSQRQLVAFHSHTVPASQSPSPAQVSIISGP